MIALDLCKMSLWLGALLTTATTTTTAFCPSSTTTTRHSVLSTSLASAPTIIDTLTSGLASICRLPGGVNVVAKGAASSSKNLQVLQLYDIENNVACRKVRERLTELDLSVELVVPATKTSRAVCNGSYKYALDSSAVVPRMVVVKDDIDNNNEQLVLSGVDDILSFLDQSFGIDSAPSDLASETIAVLRAVGNYAASLLRTGRGDRVSGAAVVSNGSTAKPLVLYSYEGNQFCRLVREVLCELDLPYELVSCGKGSSNREQMASITTGGSTQCPYLVDPNTGTKMAESGDIIEYLYEQYGKYTPPSELLEWTSKNVMTPLLKPVFSALAPLQAGSRQADTYQTSLAQVQNEVNDEINSAPIVVYTYKLSPFCTECTALLDRLVKKSGASYKEISLGLEWVPGLIAPGGAAKRAALLQMTGQSSLPHVFINGQSIGGLYSGTPGLVPGLQDGSIQEMMKLSKPAAVV